jgi:hypothetical protein
MGEMVFAPDDLRLGSSLDETAVGDAALETWLAITRPDYTREVFLLAQFATRMAMTKILAAYKREATAIVAALIERVEIEDDALARLLARPRADGAALPGVYLEFTEWFASGIANRSRHEMRQMIAEVAGLADL